MASVFVPVGTWPQGYWLEKSGKLRLVLGVDVVDGGWRWVPLRYSWGGITVPRFLTPRVVAGKSINHDGRYQFDVALYLPVLGLLFAYGGALVPQPSASSGF